MCICSILLISLVYTCKIKAICLSAVYKATLHHSHGVFCLYMNDALPTYLILLPTESDDGGVLGVRIITVTILPSCPYMQNNAL